MTAYKHPIAGLGTRHFFASPRHLPDYRLCFQWNAYRHDCPLACFRMRRGKRLTQHSWPFPRIPWVKRGGKVAAIYSIPSDNPFFDDAVGAAVKMTHAQLCIKVTYVNVTPKSLLSDLQILCRLWLVPLLCFAPEAFNGGSVSPRLGFYSIL